MQQIGIHVGSCIIFNDSNPGRDYSDWADSKKAAVRRSTGSHNQRWTEIYATVRSGPYRLNQAREKKQPLMRTIKQNKKQETDFFHARILARNVFKKWRNIYIAMENYAPTCLLISFSVNLIDVAHKEFQFATAATYLSIGLGISVCINWAILILFDPCYRPCCDVGKRELH